MPNEQVRVANRNKVVNMMYKCMSKYGIKATTKEMLARKTGLSLSSVVRYFRTKESMVETVADELEKKYCLYYADIVKVVEEDKLSAPEMFKLFAKKTINTFINNPDFFIFEAEIMHYMYRHEENGVSMAEQRYNKMIIITLLKKILEKGEREGSLHYDWDVNDEVLFVYNTIEGAMINLPYTTKFGNANKTDMIKNNLARLFTGIYTKYAEPRDEDVRVMKELFNI